MILRLKMANFSAKLWLEILLVVLILSLAAFFRFYQLPEYMTFLGDEGRDALVVKRILVDRDFPLLGPPMSVGNLYLGPLYYYMMSVSMSIFWLDPVAASAMVALIGVCGVGLIYYLARPWFGVYPAVLAAVSYAISPVVINYSKSSWNPNPLPFFSMLVILGLYKIHQTRNLLWFTLVGASLAFAIQMHYLGMLLLPVTAVLLIYEFFKKRSLKYIFPGLILGIFIFGVLMSPLVIFDFKYNFSNFQAFREFFIGKDSSLGLNPLQSATSVFNIYVYKLTTRFLAASQAIVGIIFSLIVAIPLFFALVEKIKGKSLPWSIFALFVWLILGLFGLSIYSQDVYDHYLGAFSPVVFLLLGGFVGLFKDKLRVIVFILLLSILLIINLPANPNLSSPNRQFQRTKSVSEFVIKQSLDKPFNFALIAERNYDSAYQFLMYRLGKTPKVLPVEKTDQLFVVCEDAVCNPINHPKYEIAAFGPAQIEKEYLVEGVKIFKLVTNSEIKL